MPNPQELIALAERVEALTKRARQGRPHKIYPNVFENVSPEVRMLCEAVDLLSGAILTLAQKETGK
jgi:hypothetical protein